MRSSRLLSILMLLQLRGRMTADALAAEFEVSTRTIYRDVDQLSAAGVPVYGDRGPGGGLQLLDGFRTDLTGLATDEAEALFLIGMPGPAAALGLGPAAARAANKLLAALPSARGRAAPGAMPRDRPRADPPRAPHEVGKFSTRFHLDPVDWYRAEEPAQSLPDIARAVLDQRVVTMTYESWTGIRSWRVEPLGLVLKAGAWYVVARSGKTTRIFKVANIHAHQLLETTFERPADFDLPVFWSASLQRFEAGLRSETATLHVGAAALQRLALLGAYAAQAVRAAAAADAEGGARVSLPIENVEQAALLVMGLGPDVEVLAPAALRARVHAHAMALVRRHRPARPAPDAAVASPAMARAANSEPSPRRPAPRSPRG